MFCSLRRNKSRRFEIMQTLNKLLIPLELYSIRKTSSNFSTPVLRWEINFVVFSFTRLTGKGHKNSLREVYDKRDEGNPIADFHGTLFDATIVYLDRRSWSIILTTRYIYLEDNSPSSLLSCVSSSLLSTAASCILIERCLERRSHHRHSKLDRNPSRRRTKKINATNQWE